MVVKLVMAAMADELTGGSLSHSLINPELRHSQIDWLQIEHQNVWNC